MNDLHFVACREEKIKKDQKMKRICLARLTDQAPKQPRKYNNGDESNMKIIDFVWVDLSRAKKLCCDDTCSEIMEWAAGRIEDPQRNNK